MPEVRNWHWAVDFHEPRANCFGQRSSPQMRFRSRDGSREASVLICVLAFAAIFRPRALLIAQNLCLRQQLLVLQRRHPRPRLMILRRSWVKQSSTIRVYRIRNVAVATMNMSIAPPCQSGGCAESSAKSGRAPWGVAADSSRPCQADFDGGLEQFAMDTRCAPEGWQRSSDGSGHGFRHSSWIVENGLIAVVSRCGSPSGAIRSRSLI
jgi:hypothetical protein